MSCSHHFRSGIHSGKWGCIPWLNIVWILFFLLASTTHADANSYKAQAGKDIKNLSIPFFSTVTDKEFDDVIEDLLIVIAENNFRLNQHARIGKAIARRNNISFPRATVLHFCNLNYARQLLEIAPDYLLRMPCRVSIWPKNEKSTIIEVWLLPEDDERTVEFAKKINAILINIVSYGAN